MKGSSRSGRRIRCWPRRKNPAWQKQVLGYLMSGNAVLLARRGGTGLDHASMQAIERWPVLGDINGYTLFARSGMS